MNNARLHGLDTLRACAILLVFAYHYMAFVSGEPTFGWASLVGWTGVDLFFVLSGYLIADQVFAGIAQGRHLSLRSFFIRRALRTLPDYWFVLALFFLFPAVMGGRQAPPLWAFLTFTQNFGLRTGTAFSHAWSLCIEEQFYLILPLATVAAMRFSALRKRVGWVLAGLVIVGVAARSLLWLRYGADDDPRSGGYYTHIYYTTLCRFDEFLPGVAVAMLKNFHHATWERLMRHGRSLFAAGVAATACMLYLVLRFYRADGHGYGFFMTGFGYTLVAAAFALLMTAALSPQCWLNRMRIPGARQLALWSYAIYLTHKPIAYIVGGQLASFDLPETATPVIIAAACLAGGFLLYRGVETPFMALRRRIAPGIFTDAAYGAADATASRVAALP